MSRLSRNLPELFVLSVLTWSLVVDMLDNHLTEHC